MDVKMCFFSRPELRGLQCGVQIGSNAEMLVGGEMTSLFLLDLARGQVTKEVVNVRVYIVLG